MIPRPWRARHSLVRHLALYTTFHRSLGNRWTHGVSVPVILFTMLLLLAYVRVPVNHPLSCFLHAGTPVALLLFWTLALVDRAGSVALLGFTLPASGVAGWISHSHSPLLVVPVAIGVHLVAWYGTVVVGHEKIEPPIRVGGGAEDSNLYFRRGYYLGRGWGLPVGLLDSLIQFSIAPLSVVQDILVVVGLRRGLQARIEAERAAILEHLSRCVAPWAGEQGHSLRGCEDDASPLSHQPI